MLLEHCLLPFRAGGSRVITGIEAEAGDGHGCDARAVVPVRAVLVVDGVFLLGERLRDLWTVAIHLRVSPEECLDRARRRDVAVLGSAAEVERRYRSRYLPGQVLYRDDAAPEAAANVLIDNEDPTRPVVLRWPS